MISERQVQVLLLVVDGKTNNEIAKELNISMLTVKNHVQNLLRETNTENRVGLVKYAFSSGIAKCPCKK